VKTIVFILPKKLIYQIQFSLSNKSNKSIVTPQI